MKLRNSKEIQFLLSIKMHLLLKCQSKNARIAQLEEHRDPAKM
jgi:hypothetical protein